MNDEKLRSLQSTSSQQLRHRTYILTCVCLVACDNLLDAKFGETGLPGAQFIALSRDGTTLYSRAVGTKAIDSVEPMTDDTVGSISSYKSR